MSRSMGIGIAGLAVVAALVAAAAATGYEAGRRRVAAVALLEALRADPTITEHAGTFDAMLESLKRKDVQRIEQCFLQSGLQPPTIALREIEEPWARPVDPMRDEMTSTRLIEEALAVEPGMRVADVGAGAGYFTFRLAEKVGEAGAVWATDTNPDMVVRISRETRRRELHNVQTVLVYDDQVGLPDGLDRAVLVNVYLFDDCRPKWNARYLRDLASRLEPGGRLVVYEDFGLPRGKRCRTLPLDALVEAASAWFTVVDSAPSPFEADPEAGQTTGFLVALERRPGPLAPLPGEATSAESAAPAGPEEAPHGEARPLKVEGMEEPRRNVSPREGRSPKKQRP